MSGEEMIAKPIPQGKYVAASRHRDLIVTAGMTPRENGRMMFVGPVRAEQVDASGAAVRLACANALIAAEDKLGPREMVVAILSMTVYVAAEERFAEHSKVADHASAYLQEKLGTRGACSRCAVGVASLPGNAPVEIQLTVVAGPARGGQSESGDV